MIEDIVIRKALPEDAEEIARLYNEVYGGKYPLGEFTNQCLIEENLKAKKDVWYLAFFKEMCIGSAVCAIERENNSAELGRAVIKKDFRGNSISRQLYEIVREETLGQGVDILWALIRNKATYEISKNDGLTLVGHSESYILDKGREVLLFGLRITPEGQKKRVIPHNREIYQIDGVKRIVEEMHLGGEEGKYPLEVVAKMTLKGEPASIKGMYHRPNKSFAATFIPETDSFPEHFEATILADKINHIRFLQSAGFSITAFLPGWYKKEGKRYDCVLLTSLPNQIAVCDEQIKPLLENLINEFMPTKQEEENNPDGK